MAVRYVDIVNQNGVSLNVMPEVSINSGVIEYEDLYKSASRNVEGVLKKVFTRTIRKISITFALLTCDEWSTLINYIKTNKEFYLKFYDPETNTHEIMTAYAGNRSSAPYLVDKNTGKPRYYKDCQCNLIEV